MSEAVPIEWADERAGMCGEEREHTLNLDPDDDPEKVGLMQVWDDHADDGTPFVGTFGSYYAEKHEWRGDLLPDQALDLAAMLIVHAHQAREAAIERAMDAEDERA